MNVASHIISVLDNRYVWCVFVAASSVFALYYRLIGIINPHECVTYNCVILIPYNNPTSIFILILNKKMNGLKKRFYLKFLVLIAVTNPSPHTCTSPRCLSLTETYQPPPVTSIRVLPRETEESLFRRVHDCRQQPRHIITPNTL